MTIEQKKEICKSHFYGWTVEQIAEIEHVSIDDANNAIAWGKQSGYFDELEERRKDVYGE